MPTVTHHKNNSVASKAATALTNAYASGWAFDADLGSLSKLTLLLDYVHSDATSVQIQMHYSHDGVTYYPLQDLSSNPVTTKEPSWNVSGSATWAVELDLPGVQYLRVVAKHTGGSGAGNTLAARLIGGDY